ncbi:MAG: Maf family protein [Candidatus Alcyoniella australis]|nr:Maf family protein [Candidatus Alcyoniella australis]
MKKFVLASASPRRKELLGSLGLDFIIDPAHVDESALPGEGPEKHTLRLAQTKARTVAARHPGFWVLGADTAVVIDELILGKPRDVEDAVAMLLLIQGRSHTVVSAFAFCGGPHDACESAAVASQVELRSLTPAQARWYVSTGEPMDKAGAYAIQGIGACLVRSVRGSYTNVVGLPLAETIDVAARLEILDLEELR